jgi:topoisomerase-4 subunit A
MANDKNKQEAPQEQPEQQPEAESKKEGMVHQIHIDGMYENWFLDYASYVILERAVPSLTDGLKPVQRRILHAMKEIDDGRFNKVANIIGQTMQYHPHGDAAIGDAMVNMGQKDIFIETQGNWGDIRTGDSAAAPRYIEARLSKLALDIAFNKETTAWQLSYDGRKNEPINLPMKFPTILSQGAEGIAVGLATKIMPHNFMELCKGSIQVLKGKKTKLLPDFPTGGFADFSNYNEGLKGSRIRVRAKIEVVDKRTLAIRDIPFGTTTTHLIESIVKANENKKIKITKVVDNTAAEVEIMIELPSGVSPDVTLDALFAFTDCETSISPNACVIVDGKPRFIGTNDMLEISTEKTKELLKRELEIKLGHLEDKWHYSSLEKIFIENRIYRDIEECETWEAVIKAIDKGLKPHIKILKREITEEDIVRLTEIKIKRISKFDSIKADEEIKKLEDAIKETKGNLKNLTEFAITYFEELIAKHGKGRERKTEIKTFDTIQVTQVAVANRKLYVNRKEGFVGWGLKKDELIGECSDLDDIIVFRKDGKFSVSKVTEKNFIGKDIIHAGVWKKGDDRMTYNVAYLDGKTKRIMAKRFAVTAMTRDKEYDVTKGSPDSKMVYFSANPNSESELVHVVLHEKAGARVKAFDYDFGELAIKGRGSQGNILTKYAIRKIERKAVGESTIGGRDIWLDDIVGRLNTEERGTFLGNFDTKDTILVLYKDGSYVQTNHELTNRYEMENIISVQKWDPEMVVSAVHFDGEKKSWYVKRFQIETSTIGQKFPYITEHKDSKLLIATTSLLPMIEFKHEKGRQKEKVEEKLNLQEFIDVKGWKAIGNKLLFNKITAMKLIEIEPAELPVPEETPAAQTEELEEKAKEVIAEEAVAVKETPAAKSAPKKEPAAPATKKKESFEPGSEVELEVPKDSKKVSTSSARRKGDQGQLF